MTTLHLEQVGGVSGDMLLGALIDLGLDPAELEGVLSGLGAPGLRLEVVRIESKGMPAVRVRLRIDGRPAEEAPGPGPAGGSPHDHHHLHHHHHEPHGPGHAHRHHHDHPHDEAHDHHDHPHDDPNLHRETPGSGGHSHRHYGDVVRLIREAPLPDAVRDDALRIFRRLGEAEAFVHGTALERVHFHEVGEWDSIADVVGFAWGMHRLGVTRLTSGPFVFGRGEIRMAHGVWPVPAPATVRLCEGFPARMVDLEGETVTPTGAAILTTLAEFPGQVPAFPLLRAAAGAGSRDWPDRPNVVRAFLGGARDESTAELVPDLLRDEVGVVEATIDDMTPQALAALAAEILADGALDVTLQAVQMKKGRPGTDLRALTPPGREEEVARKLLARSTTLGVRLRREGRLLLRRQIMTLDTPDGPVAVKFARRPGGGWTGAPEFEDCQKISQRTGEPLHYVVDRVRELARQALLTGKIDPESA